MLNRFLTLDRVRISAILMVFLFHINRYFDTMPWHVKSSQSSLVATGWVIFWSLFIMPVIFGVSGASVRLSMDDKSYGAIIGSRVTRLLLPFILGTFVLGIPQVYIEAVSYHRFSGSLLAFIPESFKGFYGFGGNFPWMGLHLWYLGVLFIFTLLCVPVFQYLRKHNFYVLMQELTDHTILLFTPIIDIWIVDTLFSPQGILGRRDFGGWNLFVYLVVFIYGFCYYGDRDIVSKIRDQRFMYTFAGAASAAGVLWVYGSGVPEYGFTLPVLSLNLLRSIAAWCLSSAWIGWLHQPFPRADKWVRQLNPFVLPIYILHQPVIVFIGWLMAAWNLPTGLKGILLTGASGLVVCGLCMGWRAIRRSLPLK